MANDDKFSESLNRGESQLGGNPPFLLVRVQDDLHGASISDGDLRLPYQRTTEGAETRNTSHWSVNSVVSDHAYGNFNIAADGTLKGKIVIVADPRQMPVPAGLGQVDTWFRMDAQRAKDGTLERSLRVGNDAVVVAPADAQVPDGINVVRYSGGIAERDAAVQAVIEARGVKVERAGMWGWSGAQNSNEWARDVAKSLYSGSVDQIHLGSHSGSLDEKVEGGSRVRELVKNFENDRLYDRPDGLQIPMGEAVRLAIQEDREAINAVVESLSEGEALRVGAFYAARLQTLDAMEHRASAIETSWSQTVPPPLSVVGDSGPTNSEQNARSSGDPSAFIAKAHELFSGNGIEQGGNRAPKDITDEDALIASLDERMAKAQMEEWGWRDRDDLDTIMRDMETLASSNWTKAAELWEKYNPNDLDKPIFIDGDDVDVPPTTSSDDKEAGSAKGRDTRSGDGVHQLSERDGEDESRGKEFVTPDGLRKRYIEADQKFYFREDKNKLAFEDKGRRLATKHDDPEVAKAMVELAESKKWTSIKLKGTEDFKRAAWLEASLRGMQVEGYKPKDVDIAKFEELREERDAKALNTIEKGRDIAAPSRDAAHRKAREPANDKSAVVDENRETLTDKQRVAVDTLKSILRDRGDSEQAVQMAADLATERFHNNRVYVGKVVDFGTAPYDNDKKNEESYFVTLETPQGEKQVWGVDLERAVQAGEVQKGQEVAVAYQGSQKVTVPVKERDAQGKLTGQIAEVTTNRNTWDINRLDRLQETVRSRMNIAAKETDRVQPVVKVFDRDAERSTERTVVLPEKGRERERARG